MVDVTEKLKRQVRDWVSWADKYGISDDYEVNTLSLDMGTLRAMHSAREVDGETVEKLKLATDCLIWIANLGYEGAPDIAMRRAAKDTLAAIAAMGEGDVR